MTGIVTGLVLIAAASQQAGAVVHVRVVDPFRMPLPGIAVTIQAVTNCTALKAADTLSRLTTAADGSVQFTGLGAHTYAVSAAGNQSGFEDRSECIEGVKSGTAYVQLQLRPDPALQVTLIQPASSPRRSGRTRALAEFVGVYADSRSKYYEVNLLDGVDGIVMIPPDGAPIKFTKRRGNVFTGEGGEITFESGTGAVTGFFLKRSTVRAARRQ